MKSKEAPGFSPGEDVTKSEKQPASTSSPSETMVPEAFDPADLERKHAEANTRADTARNRRDVLNSEVRALMDKRALMISEMREMSDTAWNKRAERDRLNDGVREAKKLREEWNQKSSVLSAHVHELRKSRDVRRGNVSLWRLLKDLEFKHMTSSLSKEAEERLIAEMQRIQREIRDQEEKFKKDPEVVAATAEMENAKQLAEKYHKDVEEMATAAQLNHEEMGHLYEDVDRLRRELDELQAKVTTVKNASDEEHKLHIAAIEEVRDIEKLLFAAKRMAAGGETEEEPPKEEDLFARFKKGGKISTEDLMALQKGD